jgi:DMSO/TMAO reductase YedYZ heme-binding membrane subunit
MQTDSLPSAVPRVSAPFLVAVGLFCASAFAFNYSRHGFHEDSFLWTIRTVVKLAFAFFTLSYIASPLHDWRPSRASAFLMRHRATTGAAFAVAQLSAAACASVIWNHWPHIIHAISNPVDRVLGVMVFVWIFIMLVTSNQYSIQKLGRSVWSGIHTYGMIVIWLAYLLDYGRRTVEWSPVYGIFVGLLFLIMALRMRVLLRRFTAPAATRV